MHMRVSNPSMPYKIMCSEVISPTEESVVYDRQTFLAKHNMKSNLRKRKENKREHHCTVTVQVCCISATGLWIVANTLPCKRAYLLQLAKIKEV